MIRNLVRIAVTALACSGASLAASGCTALYATINLTTGTSLDYVDTTTNTSREVFPLASGITNINAAALNPVTGEVFFIDRTVNAVLLKFNPATRTTSTVGTITLPTTVNSVPIGATFDNTTGRLYVLYASYIIQEINPTTAAVLRTITVNFPATDAAGNAMTRRAANGGFGTSGDIVFAGDTAYAALDGTITAGPTQVVYWVTLGNISTGTSVTPPASGFRRITSGGANVTQGSVNGAAVTPYGVTYLSYTGTAAAPILATLNTTGATTVPVITSTANTGRPYSDLSDCTVLPDTPIITKAFSPATIRVGQTSTLTLTLSSTNPSPSYTLAPVTDTLPAGVVIASTPGVTSTCVNSNNTAPAVTAAAGSGSVTIPTGVRIPQSGASCTVTVNVTGSTFGLKNNTIPAGSLQTTAGTYGTAATAQLLVNTDITGTVTKTQRIPGGTFGTAAINRLPGDRVEYCLSAVHPGVGYAPATSAAIKDSLQANLSFSPNGYPGLGDVKVTRGAAVSYLTFGAVVSGYSYNAATGYAAGQNLSVSILPFDSGNPNAQVCFFARVR